MSFKATFLDLEHIKLLNAPILCDTVEKIAFKFWETLFKNVNRILDMISNTYFSRARQNLRLKDGNNKPNKWICKETKDCKQRRIELFRLLYNSLSMITSCTEKHWTVVFGWPTFIDRFVASGLTGGASSSQLRRTYHILGSKGVQGHLTIYMCTHCRHTSSFRNLTWKTSAFSFDDWGRKLDILWSTLSSPTLDIVRYFQNGRAADTETGLARSYIQFQSKCLTSSTKKADRIRGLM